MIATVDGNVYRVQFVHSAHDLKQSRGLDNPGGLRQFVDNMAASLRRRVTLAEISLIEEVPGPTKRSEPVVQFVPVAQGFAMCHFADQFVKSQGRARALHRALKLGQFNADAKESIASQLGYDGLRGLKAAFGPAPVSAPVVEDSGDLLGRASRRVALPSEW